jgi:hypothetical protein
MSSPTSKASRLRAFLLGALALTALMLHPQPLAAQTDACALVKAADAAALLGGTPVSKSTPGGGACTWTGAVAGHKLLILTYKNTGVPGEAAYMGAHQSAQAEENAKVSDEAGLGDKAFSTTASFGAVFVVLKRGRLLQIQYWTGGLGTSQDVAALRPVVQKAVAAF